MSGTLEIVVGPMYSGKTTELLNWLSSKKILGKCCFINSDKDSRTEKGFFTHNELMSKNDFFEIIKTNNLRIININCYNFIAIDEAQFFDDLSVIEEWLQMGKNIIIAGLDGSFKRKPIGKIFELIPLCRKITKKLAHCNKCLDQGINNFLEAPYSHKIGGDKNKIIEIGSVDKYITLCEKHWYDFEH